MHVQINEARANDLAFDVEAFSASGGFGGGVFANGGNFAIYDEQIGGGIEAIGRIDDSSAGKEKRVHAALRVALAN